MKILIPTDFSKLSKVAVQYAVKMAKKLEGELILLNVVYIDAPPRAAASVKAQSIEDAMVDNATQDCMQLINEIKSSIKGKLNISYKVIVGYPVENVVESFARHNDISLIIMGTKGASGIKKVLIGSNATAVINSCDIPVITVPEFAQFKNLKHILYATDMTNIYTEMKILASLAKLFGASIHISHVLSPKSTQKIDTNKIIADIIKKVKYPKITFTVIVNNDVAVGLDKYIADTKADMLAMFTHELSFFEKLFGKSVTRQMAFHSWIPMLTLKKEIR